MRTLSGTLTAAQQATGTPYLKIDIVGDGTFTTHEDTGDYLYGLRKNGSSDTSMGIVGRHNWGFVECDANRLIEGYKGDRPIDFFLSGYATTSGQSFFPITPVEPGSKPAKDSWGDWDLSAHIPANATGALFHVDNDETSWSYYNYGLRKKGSTANRVERINKNHHHWTPIGVDANRIVQIYRSGAGDPDVDTYLHFYLVGYTMSGVTFFTNGYTKTPGTTYSWQTVDCSSVVPEGAIGLIFEIKSGMSSYGIRKYGSTDNRLSMGTERYGVIIGCDASRRCEAYVTGPNVLYLIGYITSGAVFYVNAPDLSFSPVTSGWVDLNALPAGACMGFIEVSTGIFEPRILSVEHSETIFRGECVIRLANYDNRFSGVDVRGKQVNIAYGYVTGAGNEYSEAPPLWVIDQRLESREGVDEFVLECGDIWWKLSIMRTMGAGTRITGTKSGTFTIGEQIVGGTSAATAYVVGQGTGYIMVTNITGTLSAGETVTGQTSSQTVETIVVTSEGGPSPSWEEDTYVKDILEALLAGITTLTEDDCDPTSMCTTYQPLVTTEVNEPIRNTIRVVLNKVKCGLRMNQDGMHLMYLDPAPGSTNYDYNASHAFFSNVRQKTLVTPNRIIVVDALPTWEGGTHQFAGVANDATSQAVFDVVTRILQMEGVSSDAEAQARAEAVLARIKNESVAGSIVVPMNCGQELLDWISIADSRLGLTGASAIEGRIGSIRRVFQSDVATPGGIYTLEIGLGGVTPPSLRSADDLMDDMLGLGYGNILGSDIEGLINLLNNQSKGLAFTRYMYEGISMFTVFESLDGFTVSGGVTIAGDIVKVTTAGSGADNQYIAKYLSLQIATPSWDKPRRFKTKVQLRDDANQTGYIIMGQVGTARHVGFKVVDNDLYSSVGNGTAEANALLIENFTAVESYVLEAILEPGVQARFIVDGVEYAPVTSGLPSGTVSAGFFVSVDLTESAAEVKEIWLSQWHFLQDP